MRTVSAFSMQHTVSDRYGKQSAATRALRQFRSLYFGLAIGFNHSSRFLTNALMFWYGAQLIAHDGLRFVDFMMAMQALTIGSLGLGEAVNEIGGAKEGMHFHVVVCIVFYGSVF